MKRSRILTLVLLAALAALAALAGPWQQAEPEPPAPPTEPTATTSPPASAAATVPPDAAATAPREADRTAVASTSSYADAGQGVLGRVVDERGQPIVGAEVLLVESATNDPIQRFLSLSHNVPMLATASMRTEGDGSFRLGLRAVDDRRYEVCIDFAGCAGERRGELQIHDGEWIDLGSIALRPGVSITGRVTVAGTDLPAPAAFVRIESGNPFFDLGPGQLPHWRDRNVATVDGNGFYELRDAPRQGVFRLVAAAPGFGRQIKDQVELTAGQPMRVDFALPRGLSIAGRLDTGGAPLGAVRIEAFAKSAEPQFLGNVASDGRFFVHGLREGPHLLRIAADGYQPVAIDNVAAGTEDLAVALQARGRARVTVRDGDGTVLRQYRLGVRRYFPENGQLGAVRDSPDRVVRLEPPALQAVVDNLDVGTYVFQVDADGWARTLSPPFVLEAEHTEAEVSMLLVRGGTLLGIVVDTAGRPVAGATVTTQPDGSDDDNPVVKMLAGLTPDRITRTTAKTDAQGRFELRHLAHADYQLLVEHPDHCRILRPGIAVRADVEQSLAPITLARGTVVRGRALVDGIPTGQVRVVLTVEPTDPALGPPQKSRDETTVGRVEAVTNIDGSFELPRRIPPGVYDLRGVLQLGSDPGADPFQKLMQMKKSATRLLVQPGQAVAEIELRLTSDH